MAKFRVRYTRISFCGEEIVSPGMNVYFPENDALWSVERTYSTEVLPLVGRKVSMLDNTGNLSGSREVALLVDYATPEEAIEDAARRQAFCDAHQRGHLREEYGSRVAECDAGLAGFTANLSIPFHGARMEYTYSFALGALPGYFDPEETTTEEPIPPFPVWTETESTTEATATMTESRSQEVPPEAVAYGTDFAAGTDPQPVPYPSTAEFIVAGPQHFPMRMKLYSIDTTAGGKVCALRVKAILADSTPGRLFLTTASIPSTYTAQKNLCDLTEYQYFASNIISGTKSGPVDVDLFPCPGYEPTLADLLDTQAWLGRGMDATAVMFHAGSAPAGPCWGIMKTETPRVDMRDDPDGPYIGLYMYPNSTSYTPLKFMVLPLD